MPSRQRTVTRGLDLSKFRQQLSKFKVTWGTVATFRSTRPRQLFRSAQLCQIHDAERMTSYPSACANTTRRAPLEISNLGLTCD